ARHRGDVEDRVHPEARALDGFRILKVGADHFDASCFQIGMGPASQDALSIASRQQLLHDVPAKKAPAAGDQRLHPVSPSPPPFRSSLFSLPPPRGRVRVGGRFMTTPPPPIQRVYPLISSRCGARPPERPGGTALC